MKLSKTLSRTLDEVAAPRHSRPDSPAIYNHRQRTLDSTSSDPAMASSKQSTSSLTSERVLPAFDDERRHLPESSTKHKIRASQPYHEGKSTPYVTLSGPDQLLTGIASPISVEAYEVRPAASAPRSTERPLVSQDFGRKSDSSRSLASMQPTVAEECEDIHAVSPTRASHRMSLSSPLSFTAATHVSRESGTSIPEIAPVGSPRDSQQSLVDPGAPSTAGMATFSFHDPLVAPAPKASVTFLQPALVQHPLEASEGELSVPIMSSPSLAADGKLSHESLPNARSPLASPPLSPFLHQQMGSPPPQQTLYAPPYQFPYPPGFLGAPPFQPGFYPAPFLSSTAPFAFPDTLPRSGSAGIEDERAKLMEKVSNVLPDINRLLQYYQESQGLLSEKDHLVRQAESQHLEEVAKLRIELSASKEEYERIIGEQASENVSLKTQATELGEKISLLEASAHSAAEVTEELATLKLKSTTLESEVKEVRSLNEKLSVEKHALEDQLGSLKKQVIDDQAEHESAIKDIRSAHGKQMSEKEDDYTKTLHDHKAGLSKIQLDLAGMITKHTQQKRELDSARASVAELEHSLAAKSQALEDTILAHERELEARTKATEQTAERHEDEIDRLRALHREEVLSAIKQLSKITAEHEDREAKLQTDVKAARSDTEKQRAACRSLQTELDATREAHATLRTRSEKANKHHAELVDSMTSLRTKQAEWHRESERIDRILQSLGELGPNNGNNNNKGSRDEFL